MSLPIQHRFQTRKVRGGRGLISLRSEIEIDREKQRYVARNHYERADGEGVLEEEDETLEVRWYFPERFAEMLEGAGMSVTRWDVPALSPRPKRSVFVAELVRKALRK